MEFLLVEHYLIDAHLALRSPKMLCFALVTKLKKKN